PLSNACRMFASLFILVPSGELDTFTYAASLVLNSQTACPLRIVIFVSAGWTPLLAAVAAAMIAASPSLMAFWSADEAVTPLRMLSFAATSWSNSWRMALAEVPDPVDRFIIATAWSAV